MVVFIDDEVEILNGIRRLLLETEVDWEMLFFSDPLEAAADSRTLTSDVVVSDLLMPGMNGLDLMRTLRAKGMTAAIIILSGTGDMGAALEAINELKVFRFYIKPCPQQRLMDGITEAITLRRTSMAAADLLPFAVIALDHDKRVTFMNKEGAHMVSQGTVIAFDGGGRCRTASVAETAALHHAIDTVGKTGETVVMGVNAERGETRYSLLIEPAPSDSGNSAVFLFIMDPKKRRPPSLEALKQLFDFSNSEAKLAYGLAQGLDVKEVAESMDVTVQTARTYLKNLFDKTATNRQAELVRTLITAVPQVRSGASAPN